MQKLPRAFALTFFKEKFAELRALLLQIPRPALDEQCTWAGA